MNLFDFVDYFTANWMLPLGALAIAIFTGWVFKQSDLKDELTSSGLFNAKYFSVFTVMIKFITPILIIIVFINKVFGI